MKKYCIYCKKEIPEKRAKHPCTKFCSNICAKKQSQKDYKMKSPYKNYKLPGNTKGTIAELYVTIDLLSKGYHVFRAVSRNCFCDLIILKNKKLLRVEVTTGYIYIPSGILHYPKHKKSNYDIIAIMTAEKIIYKPELSTDF